MSKRFSERLRVYREKNWKLTYASDGVMAESELNIFRFIMKTKIFIILVCLIFCVLLFSNYFKGKYKNNYKAIDLYPLHNLSDDNFQNAKGFNLILISIDTLRADYLGCYGKKDILTPNIDKLSKEGILLQNCFSVASSTLASHSSLMTSKYPHTHGVPKNGYRLSDENITLAEILKENGYETGAVVGSLALESGTNFNQGFNSYNEKDLSGVIIDDEEPYYAVTAEKVNRRAIEWLEKNHKKKFFLFLHYWDPHSPYLPKPPYDSMYDKGYKDEIITKEQQLFQLMHALKNNPSKDDIYRAKHLLSLYMGEISYVDHQIGLLMSKIKEMGLIENTIIVLTSDHGETMLEHDKPFDHSHRTYDTTIHIPLIICSPSVLPANRKVGNLVSNIDVVPTILNFLGVQPIDDFEGKSFFKLLFNNHSGGRKNCFSEATDPKSTDNNWQNVLNSNSVRTQKWKYIETTYLGRKELFEVLSDPGEKNNVFQLISEVNPDLIVEMKTALDKWLKTTPKIKPDSSPLKEENLKEKLKSLGYVN